MHAVMLPLTPQFISKCDIEFLYDCNFKFALKEDEKKNETTTEENKKNRSKNSKQS